MDTRVGEGQLGKGEMQVVVVKDVEVDGAWRMMGMPARPPQQLLDTLQAMKKVKEVRTQILDICSQLKMRVETCGTDWDQV